MLELAPTLLPWIREGRRFAIAVVVQAKGSAPRGKGSAMAVRDDGLIAGSVSGGCVESAVVQAALRSLQTGRGEMLQFGANSDATLFEVGLSCGGQIRVWVCPVLDGVLWGTFLETAPPVAWSFRLDPSNPEFRYGADALPNTESTLFGQEEADRRLVIIGAVHITVALVRLANAMGLSTIVIEPRQVFAREERFPIRPDQLIPVWPQDALPSLNLGPADALVTLSHDPKIDDPALKSALEANVGYIGALGSRKTQAQKRENLKTMGVSEAELERIHGPIGLDIGSATPEEIALSILAEIVQTQRKAIAR